MSRLTTRVVRCASDVQEFFDAIAADYAESHGSPDVLLEYRLALIRRLLPVSSGRGVLLEIGCGTAAHLFRLADAFGSAIGADLSPKMIARAQSIRPTHSGGARIELYAEPAEHLASIGDRSVDAVLCVGAFEHMPEKPAVLREVCRVLKAGGRFVCLTLNGDYLWYRHIAPRLGYETKHLSSDGLINEDEMRALLRASGFKISDLGYWRFIAAGDMPSWAAVALQLADRVGMMCMRSLLRGGMYVCAENALTPDTAQVNRVVG